MVRTGGDGGRVDRAARRRRRQAAGFVGFGQVRAKDVVVKRAFEAVEDLFLRAGRQGQAALRNLADLDLGQVSGRLGQDVLQSAVGSGQLIDQRLAVKGGARADAALGAGRGLFRCHGVSPEGGAPAPPPVRRGRAAVSNDEKSMAGRSWGGPAPKRGHTSPCR